MHEFCHSFVNPLIDRNRNNLRESGEAIFPHLREKLKDHGYNFWYVMYYEYMTRACVIRYLASKEGPGAVSTQIRRDERDGFPGIQNLAELLSEYESFRDKYTDLDAFMPRIVDYFDKLAITFQ